ncbi:MAG: kinase-like domain-containing protein, partial [Piptocephalis tieghemiana]
MALITSYPNMHAYPKDLGIPSSIIPKTLVGLRLHAGPGSTLHVQAQLGAGTYGTVYSAKCTQTGRMYAVKHVPQQGEREIRLHRRCSGHPNILTLHHAFQDPRVPGWLLQLDYCPEGDLFHRIASGSKGEDQGLDPEEARRLFIGVCDAVAWCHAQGVAHRDIKPENILLVHDPMTGNLQPRLADFGLATARDLSREHGRGSSTYMSPECRIHSNETYSTMPSDVWSLGMLLCNLTTGFNAWREPISTDDAFMYYARRPETGLQEILGLSDELNWILRSTFRIRPWLRVSVLALRDMVRQCMEF